MNTLPDAPFSRPGMQKGRPSGRPLPFHAAGAGFSPVPADMLNKEKGKNSITKRPSVRMACLFYWMPGSSLLSHGETPHYHRRYGVSLLSSAWGQVGPPRSCRQANLGAMSCVFFTDTALAAFVLFSHILMYAPSHHAVAALSQRKILRTYVRRTQLNFYINNPELR